MSKRYFTMRSVDGDEQVYVVARDEQHALELIDAEGPEFGDPSVCGSKSGLPLVEMTVRQASLIRFRWDDDAPHDAEPPGPMSTWDVGECRTAGYL